MDGALGAYVRAQVEKSGLVGMNRIWDNGFRQITSSSKPITAPDNLGDFRIHVPARPFSTSLSQTFGLAPAGINLAKVYSALQARVVDGQEKPLAVISTAKFWEVQTFCALTNHV